MKLRPSAVKTCSAGKSLNWNHFFTTLRLFSVLPSSSSTSPLSFLPSIRPSPKESWPDALPSHNVKQQAKNDKNEEWEKLLAGAFQTWNTHFENSSYPTSRGYATKPPGLHLCSGCRMWFNQKMWLINVTCVDQWDVITVETEVNYVSWRNVRGHVLHTVWTHTLRTQKDNTVCIYSRSNTHTDMHIQSLTPQRFYNFNLIDLILSDCR